MEPRAETARKARLHGGWIGETILGLLEEIERLESLTVEDENRAKPSDIAHQEAVNDLTGMV